jgi:hypothetical protein
MKTVYRDQHFSTEANSNKGCVFWRPARPFKRHLVTSASRAHAQSRSCHTLNGRPRISLPRSFSGGPRGVHGTTTSGALPALRESRRGRYISSILAVVVWLRVSLPSASRSEQPTTDALTPMVWVDFSASQTPIWIVARLSLRIGSTSTTAASPSRETVPLGYYL